MKALDKHRSKRELHEMPRDPMELNEGWLPAEPGTSSVPAPLRWVALLILALLVMMIAATMAVMTM
ncbi:MAG: hypothetical protein AB7K24_26405 [Gemmataceae bacterium]